MLCRKDTKGYRVTVTKRKTSGNIALELIIPSPKGIDLLNYIAFVSASVIILETR